MVYFRTIYSRFAFCEFEKRGLKAPISPAQGHEVAGFSGATVAVKLVHPQPSTVEMGMEGRRMAARLTEE